MRVFKVMFKAYRHEKLKVPELGNRDSNRDSIIKCLLVLSWSSDVILRSEGNYWYHPFFFFFS